MKPRTGRANQISVIVLTLLLWSPTRVQSIEVDDGVREDIQSLLNAVSDIPPIDEASIARRVEKISTMLLGRPFAWNPIGEGPQSLDPDPLIESRRFDCLSFIEFAIGVARANSIEDVVTDLVDLRYSSLPATFLNRNHFVSVEWLPGSLKKGVLRDATTDSQRINRGAIAVAIDRSAWFRMIEQDPTYSHQLSHASAKLIAEAAQTTLGLTDIRSGMLEFGDIRDEWMNVGERGLSRESVFNQIPTGTVILFVRPKSPYLQRTGTQEVVSHAGLLIRKPEGPVLRGSTPLHERAVQDRPLANYAYLTHKSNGPIGIIALRVLPRNNRDSSKVGSAEAGRCMYGRIVGGETRRPLAVSYGMKSACRPAGSSAELNDLTWYTNYVHAAGLAVQ